MKKVSFIRTNSVLDEICSNKVEEIKKLVVSDIKPKLSKKTFAEAIKCPHSLIAEIKNFSPSNIGKPFRQDFDPIKIAQIYQDAGAAAISVITDEMYFGGSFEYLASVCGQTNLPVLCKEFILSEIQIEHAARLGASAVLLMVCLLSTERLAELYKFARSLQLDVLVEVHNIEELQRALTIKPEIIGVNNRDLTTLNVNIDNFVGLAQFVPSNVIKVAESGIKSSDDAKKMFESGANAILVGTELMKSVDIAQKLKEFTF